MTRKADIKEMRQYFRQNFNSRRKIRLSFDELLELFQDPSIRFNEIAQRSGVTRQCIAQIYRRYFEDICGVESGHKRTRLYTLERSTRLKKKLLPHSPFLRRVIERIQRFEHLDIKLVPTKHNPLAFLKTHLEIEGVIYRIHKLTHVVFVSGRPKVLCHISQAELSKSRFIIVYVCPSGHQESFFVLPSHVIRDNYKVQNDGYTVITLPLSRSTKPQRVDFDQFKDAWSLLWTAVMHAA